MDRNKPAAAVLVKKVLIKCEDFHPKWVIRLTKTRGVTCGDVFDAIYDFLRQPLKDAELDDIPAERLAAIKRSFERRCRDKAVELVEVEQRQGLKRVDFLAGKTVFCGLCLAPDLDVLTQDSKADDCPWMLKLGRERS